MCDGLDARGEWKWVGMRPGGHGGAWMRGRAPTAWAQKNEWKWAGKGKKGEGRASADARMCDGVGAGTVWRRGPGIEMG